MVGEAVRTERCCRDSTVGEGEWPRHDSWVGAGEVARRRSAAGDKESRRLDSWVGAGEVCRRGWCAGARADKIPVTRSDSDLEDEEEATDEVEARGAVSAERQLRFEEPDLVVIVSKSCVGRGAGIGFVSRREMWAKNMGQGTWKGK